VGPTPEEIRGQLDRIVASESFVNSERLSRFLRYVVERTLAGEGDRLKEYVIGTEVFERGERYDPRIDSIVRVEAGRLRSKLDGYYNRYGSSDPVVIRMPRGGYAPVFEARPAATAKPPRRVLPLAGAAAAILLIAIVAWGSGFWAAAERPTTEVRLAVLPFSSYSADKAVGLMAARLTDGVTSELARLGTLDVVSHTSALQFAGVRRPLRDVARSLNADMVLEGSVEADADRLRVMVRLVDAANDRKVWVEEFMAGTAEVHDLQRRIAAAAGRAATQRAGS
jgi:adenylate cyclase